MVMAKTRGTGLCKEQIMLVLQEHFAVLVRGSH